MKATLTLQDGRSITLEEKDVEELLKKQKTKVAFDGTVINDSLEEIFSIYTGRGKENWSRFDTEENAEKFDNRMQALWHIKKWVAENDNGFVPDWSDYKQDKYNIYVSLEKKLFTSEHGSDCENPDFPYMSSAKIAVRCISECREHLEVYFNVK